MTFQVRAMTDGDVDACLGIINPIIAAGGSTAYEHPYDADGFRAEYLNEAKVSLVALQNDRLVGFQACFEVEPGVYSIGSFTDRNHPAPGAGRVLFEATVAASRANGASHIMAKITSDNVGGLAYYSKMGFADDHVVSADLTRADGTVVDRVIKRYSL